MTLSVHFVWFWSLHMCWNLVWNTCNAHVNKYVNRIAEFRVQYKQLSESDIGMDSFWKMKMSANWRKRTYCSEQSHVWDKKKRKKSHLANKRRSSGFCAAGTRSMACRSCSVRLARSVSVILLLRGESPPVCSSALEFSILGLVRVMSSLLAAERKWEKLYLNIYLSLLSCECLWCCG